VIGQPLPRHKDHLLVVGNLPAFSRTGGFPDGF
jgi:hypothetical protein